MSTLVPYSSPATISAATYSGVPQSVVRRQWRPGACTAHPKSASFKRRGGPLPEPEAEDDEDKDEDADADADDDEEEDEDEEEEEGAPSPPSPGLPGGAIKRMFSGLRSRCITEWLWRNRSASLSCNA